MSHSLVWEIKKYGLKMHGGLPWHIREFTGVECSSELGLKFKFNKYLFHMCYMPSTGLEHSSSTLEIEIPIVKMTNNS
jgi:hypothetical protein